MPIGIMGRKSVAFINWGLRCSPTRERDGVKTFVYAVSLYVAETPQSKTMNPLPIIRFGIVAHGFVGQPFSKQLYTGTTVTPTEGGRLRDDFAPKVFVPLDQRSENERLWEQPFWNYKRNNRILPIRSASMAHAWNGCSQCNLVPRASFPLTSGRKTKALGATIPKEQRKWPNSGYLVHCASTSMVHAWIVASKTLVFRSLVNGNEALATRLLPGPGRSHLFSDRRSRERRLWERDKGSIFGPLFLKRDQASPNKRFHFNK